jgi:hypothetical protein
MRRWQAGRRASTFSGMRKGLVPASVLVLLAVLAAVLIRSHRQGEEAKPSSQPAWVTAAVASMRRSFVGNPTPSSVRYHEGSKAASVTIRFSDPAVCSQCTRPAGAAPPRGRVATLSVDPRTHGTLGFGLK